MSCKPAKLLETEDVDWASTLILGERSGHGFSEACPNSKKPHLEQDISQFTEQHSSEIVNGTFPQLVTPAEDIVQLTQVMEEKNCEDANVIFHQQNTHAILPQEDTLKQDIGHLYQVTKEHCSEVVNSTSLLQDTPNQDIAQLSQAMEQQSSEVVNAVSSQQSMLSQNIALVMEQPNSEAADDDIFPLQVPPGQDISQLCPLTEQQNSEVVNDIFSLEDTTYQNIAQEMTSASFGSILKCLLTGQEREQLPEEASLVPNSAFALSPIGQNEGESVDTKTSPFYPPDPPQCSQQSANPIKSYSNQHREMHTTQGIKTPSCQPSRMFCSIISRSSKRKHESLVLECESEVLSEAQLRKVDQYAEIVSSLMDVNIRRREQKIGYGSVGDCGVHVQCGASSEVGRRAAFVTQPDTFTLTSPASPNEDVRSTTLVSVSASQQPVMGSHHQVMVNSEPSIASDETITADLEQANSEPVIVNHNSVTGDLQPVSVNHEPIITGHKPITASQKPPASFTSHFDLHKASSCSSEGDGITDGNKIIKKSYIEPYKFPMLHVFARPKATEKKDNEQLRKNASIMLKRVVRRDPHQFVAWMLSSGLLPAYQYCRQHCRTFRAMTSIPEVTTNNGPVTIDMYMWDLQCSCKKKLRNSNNCFFACIPNDNVAPTSILKIIYYWSCYTTALKMVNSVKIGRMYISQLYRYLRAVCTIIVQNQLCNFGKQNSSVSVGIIDIEGLGVVVGVYDFYTISYRLFFLSHQSGPSQRPGVDPSILQCLLEVVHPAAQVICDQPWIVDALRSMNYSKVHLCDGKKNSVQKGQIGNFLTNGDIVFYLKNHVMKLLQKPLVKLSESEVQLVLNELCWRERYGQYGAISFINMLSHIKSLTAMEAEVGSGLLHLLEHVASYPQQSCKYKSPLIMDSPYMALKSLSPRFSQTQVYTHNKVRSAPLEDNVWRIQCNASSAVENIEVTPEIGPLLSDISTMEPANTTMSATLAVPNHSFSTNQVQAEHTNQMQAIHTIPTSKTHSNPVTHTNQTMLDHTIYTSQNPNHTIYTNQTMPNQILLDTSDQTSIIESTRIPDQQIKTEVSDQNCAYIISERENAESRTDQGINDTVSNQDSVKSRVSDQEIVQDQDTVELEVSDQELVSDQDTVELGVSDQRINLTVSDQDNVKSRVPDQEINYTASNPDFGYLASNQDNVELGMPDQKINRTGSNQDYTVSDQDNTELREPSQEINYTASDQDEAKLSVWDPKIYRTFVSGQDMSKTVSQVNRWKKKSLQSLVGLHTLKKRKHLEEELAEELITETTSEKPKGDPNQTDVPKLKSLETFYYGFIPGNPTLGREFNAFVFQCHLCSSVMANNIVFYDHMKGHISSNQSTDRTLCCTYCLLHFTTSSRRIFHEKVAHHNVYQGNRWCRICSQRQNDRKQLYQHLSSVHCEAELPYRCHICHFATSFFYAIIDHFRKVHSNTPYVQCHLCLCIWTISEHNASTFSIRVSCHLRYHLVNRRKCTRCVLEFSQTSDLYAKHQREDHVSRADCEGLKRYKPWEFKDVFLSKRHKFVGSPRNVVDKQSLNSSDVPYTSSKGIVNSTEVTVNPSQVSCTYSKSVVNSNKATVNSNNSIFISSEADSSQPPSSTTFSVVTCLNVTINPNSDDNSDQVFYCIECDASLTLEQHFPAYVKCHKCVYTTCCRNMMSRHWLAFHPSSNKQRYFAIGPPIPLHCHLRCLCGHSNVSGNALARHLALCKVGDKTGYPCRTPTLSSQCAALSHMKRNPPPLLSHTEGTD